MTVFGRRNRSPHVLSRKQGEVMKIGALVLAAGLALPALSASAQSVTLAGDELRQAISGKTVYLKISGFELPIVYSANGRMKGTMGRSHEFLARRWRFGPRQVVGGERPALPEMDELDGRPVLLLQTYARRQQSDVGAQ
ncbi:MAG: hypothetical protein WA863_09045 [Methyloceanibacter sp.]